MKKWYIIFLPALQLLLPACNQNKQSDKQQSQEQRQDNYAADRTVLLKADSTLLELKSSDGNARLLLSPKYQGRVMTSTARGDSGRSYGWLNYSLLESGSFLPQFNPVGGEERFWMGPEGGQYSLFFKSGDSFDIKHWQVPAWLDTLPFAVRGHNDSSASFAYDARFTNYKGIAFSLDINRTVEMLNRTELSNRLGITLPDSIDVVGYQSRNLVKNTGRNPLTKDNGLVSVWLLGMFKPSPQTVAILPFRNIKHARSYITDNYFGSVPPQRLKVKDSIIVFTCDGKWRSKIGLSPRVAKDFVGSFDFKNNILTLLQGAPDSTKPYVNSQWKIQEEPYQGDALNAYNDGPLADGKQMGPFYELETSSPALELGSGQGLEYRQLTCHLSGSYEALRAIALKVLNIDLNDIATH